MLSYWLAIVINIIICQGAVHLLKIQIIPIDDEN